MDSGVNRIRQTRSFPPPLGRITVECAGEFITGLWFEGQKYFGCGRIDVPEGTSGALEAAFAWLERYFAGEQPEPEELQLRPEGTAFQREVWRELTNIHSGETVTYGALAERLGRPKSARAVGAAVGRNPISIIIPCHRVVGADGALTGYAGGVERKKWLLAHEKSAQGA